MDEEMYDVFISYRSSDVLVAQTLYERLKSVGLSVWFDKARLNPGFNWHLEIEHGCERSRIILPVLTPDWKESEWCRFETYGGEHVIPLLLAGKWAEVAPPPLRAYQFIDFRNQSDANWDKLVASIRNYLRQAPPNKSQRLAFVSYAHNVYFVERDRLLSEIHELLHQEPTTALTQASVYVITGLGGVGKTTLVREYAEKFWRVYQDILWVRADPALLTTEFARLALQLGLVKQPSQDANEDARWAFRELNSRKLRLLILDNAVDEESVRQWIPTSGACRTLISSRFTGWSASVLTRGVDVLSPDAAQELLLRRSGLDVAVNGRAADRVAHELGYLPLALEQAAAFVRKSSIDFDQYSGFYAQARRDLLAQRGFGGTHYPDSVATTWRTTIARLGPLARAMLCLASFMAPDNIPIELVEIAGKPLTVPFMQRMLSLTRSFFRGIFKRGTEASMDQPTGARFSPSILSIRAALSDLADYSMISLHRDDFSVHRLVQAVQVDSLIRSSQRTWAKRVVLALYCAFPEAKFSNFPLCARLHPHAKVASALVTRYRFRFSKAALLLNQLATYLQRRGQYEQAEALFLQALQVWRTSLLGKRQPNYASGLNNLANVYLEEGKYVAAEPLLQQALKITAGILGKNSSTYADYLNSLGVLYNKMGRPTAAEPLLQRALQIRRAISGEHHVNYGQSLNNLALHYIDQANYAAAELLLRQAAEIYRTVLGENDPYFAQILNNLAVVYYKQKNFTAAEPAYRQAFAIRQSALGDDHPELAYIQTNLATLYRDMGNYAAAEGLYRKALKVRQAAQGVEHPEFAHTLSHLGVLYDATERQRAAEFLHRRALTLLRDTLGDNHPLVAKLLDHLAASLRRARRIAEAEEAEARAEAIRNKQPTRLPRPARLLPRYGQDEMTI
jgi:tetratricopeptide (TPR) repeat protein